MDAHAEARVDIALEVLGVPLQSRQDVLETLQLSKNRKLRHQRIARLVQFGSLVLPLVIGVVSHDSGTQENLSVIASRCADANHLNKVGRNLCFDVLIREDPDKQISISLKNMANTIRGLIGIVFEEGGLSLAEVAVHNMGILDKEEIPGLKMGCRFPVEPNAPKSKNKDSSKSNDASSSS